MNAPRGPFPLFRSLHDHRFPSSPLKGAIARGKHLGIRGAEVFIHPDDALRGLDLERLAQPLETGLSDRPDHRIRFGADNQRNSTPSCLANSYSKG